MTLSFGALLISNHEMESTSKNELVLYLKEKTRFSDGVLISAFLFASAVLGLVAACVGLMSALYRKERKMLKWLSYAFEVCLAVNIVQFGTTLYCLVRAKKYADQIDAAFLVWSSHPDIPIMLQAILQCCGFHHVDMECKAVGEQNCKDCIFGKVSSIVQFCTIGMTFIVCFQATTIILMFFSYFKNRKSK